MLAGYLTKESVILKTGAKDKAGLFSEFSKKALAAGYVTSAEEMAAAVMEKEKEGVMELKPHVVLPHARGPFVKELFVMLGVFKDETPYEGAKGGKAGLVFFIGVPPGDQDYLKLLASISRLLSDESFVDSMMRSEVRDDVLFNVKKHSLKLEPEKKERKKFMLLLTLNVAANEKMISTVMAEAGAGSVTELHGKNMSNGLSFMSFFSAFGIAGTLNKVSKTYMGLTNDPHAAAEVYALLRQNGVDLEEHGTGSVTLIETKVSYGGFAEDIF